MRYLYCLFNRKQIMLYYQCLKSLPIKNDLNYDKIYFIKKDNLAIIAISE